MEDDAPREKRWKAMYTREDKLARARQLGFGYPRDEDLSAPDSEPIAHRNVLFICSRNQWRSPTAERVWRKHPALSVRSAGTSPNARRRLVATDVQWADVIFVMEEKHRARLVAGFARLTAGKTIHVLDIPDEYTLMDPALVEEVEASVGALLGLDPPPRRQ